MKWTTEALRYRPRKLGGNAPNVDWMAQRLNGGLLLDIGANVGVLCIATLLKCPGSRCVAFEPQTRVADALEGLVKANDVNVKLHRRAVGANSGMATLRIPAKPNMSGWATLAPMPDFKVAETELVPVTTLDAWWQEAGKPDVQVAKVDTQGAEVDVLISGSELFKTVPYLLIEIHGPTLAEHGRTEEELLHHLEALNYTWARDRDNLRCEKRPR